MPTMVPRHAIRVHRDGKNVVPPIGQPFDFTTDEIQAVRSHNFHALRKPVNEGQRMTAVTETDLLGGAAKPAPGDTRDARLLSLGEKISGDPGSRNQGGSTEEGNAARGNPREIDVTMTAAEDAPRAVARKAPAKPKVTPTPASDEDDDEL